MRVPDSLANLVHDGIIEEVVRPLMSGKEAHVYLVISGGEYRVAKVYTDAQQRSFQNRADYTEGRRVRSSRDQRAIDKGSKHGKAQDEAAWRSTEVDMIYRLRDARVRVPTPHHFVDGVLVMELIKDAHGEPAPRLADVTFSAAEASAIFKRLLGEVQRMLCAGVVHGDLSDFNLLMAADGPVLIDFPQAVNAARNQNARKLLVRDVDNLHRFLARATPGYVRLPYAEEMWHAYERGELTPDMPLTGKFRGATGPVKLDGVISVVRGAQQDEQQRRARQGKSMRGASDPTPPPVYQGRPLHMHPTLAKKGKPGQPQPKQQQRPQQSQQQQHPRSQQSQQHPRSQQSQQHPRSQQSQQHPRSQQHSNQQPQQASSSPSSQQPPKARRRRRRRRGGGSPPTPTSSPT